MRIYLLLLVFGLATAQETEVDAGDTEPAPALLPAGFNSEVNPEKKENPAGEEEKADQPTETDVKVTLVLYTHDENPPKEPNSGKADEEVFVEVEPPHVDPPIPEPMIELPPVELPQLPQVELPQLPKGELPYLTQVELPQLPQVELPYLEYQSGELPEVELPLREYLSEGSAQVELPLMNMPTNTGEVRPGSSDNGQDYQYMYMESATAEAETLLEIDECPNVTAASSIKKRIRAWLCEYTKYTIHTIAWIERFEEWWAGCEESEDGANIWQGSKKCPNTTMVKCKCPSKLKCLDDRMGCKRCMCTDGAYKDSTALYKLWTKEMKMFKTRFEIYKSKVESCTRTGGSFTAECDEDEDGEEMEG